jgi:hypothetical protein
MPDPTRITPTPPGNGMVPLTGQETPLVRSLRAVLAERERELLEVKGACSHAACRLHRAHAGPCDVPRD